MHQPQLSRYIHLLKHTNYSYITPNYRYIASYITPNYRYIASYIIPHCRYNPHYKYINFAYPGNTSVAIPGTPPCDSHRGREVSSSVAKLFAHFAEDLAKLTEVPGAGKLSLGRLDGTIPWE